MTTPTQTKPGAVTPGPWGKSTQYTDNGGMFTAVARRDVFEYAVDENGISEEHEDLFVDALNVKHTTGKTPSELAAEVAVLTAQLAEVREQRDYYRGVPAGAEVARLERAGAAAFEAMRKSQAEVERLTTQVESLTVEVEEESHIQGRMAQLLAGAIVAIRGPEPELTRWGYHDLPERVRDVVAQRDVLLAASNRVTAAFRALGVADGVARNMQARNGCERALVALDAAIHQCEGAKA